MKIAIGSDHAGLELKQAVLDFLKESGVAFRDFGAYSPDSVDYPDIGAAVAEAVAKGDFEAGILICGTGIGMSIAANKVPGIRAALCTSTYCAEMAREHNNANILVLGSRVTDMNTALDIVRTWLKTDFPNEPRHAKRIDKISGIEAKYNGGGR